MSNNYTPLQIDKVKKPKDKTNLFLLSVLTFFTAILAVFLFILIQRKINQPPAALPEVAPVPTLVPTALPSLTPTSVSTPSPTLEATSSGTTQ